MQSLTHIYRVGIGLGSTKEIGALGTGIALHKTLAGFAVGELVLKLLTNCELLGKKVITVVHN